MFHEDICYKMFKNDISYFLQTRDIFKRQKRRFIRPSNKRSYKTLEINSRELSYLSISRSRNHVETLQKSCRGKRLTLVSPKRVTGLEIMRSQERRSVWSVGELTLRKSDYVVTHSTDCLLTLALASVRANCV